MIHAISSDLKHISLIKIILKVDLSVIEFDKWEKLGGLRVIICQRP